MSRPQYEQRQRQHGGQQEAADTENRHLYIVLDAIEQHAKDVKRQSG